MLCGSYFCPVKFSSQCLKLPHFVYIISSSCMCVIDLVFSDIHSYVFCVFASHPFLFKYILYHKTSPPFPHNPITIHTRWQDGDWFYLSPSQLTCGQGATVATILGSRSTIEWLDLSREKKWDKAGKRSRDSQFPHELLQRLLINVLHKFPHLFLLTPMSLLCVWGTHPNTLTSSIRLQMWI